MNISVFGMGYVGIVCSACLVKLGHSVIGVDVNSTKVSMINDGLSPIIEPELDEYLSEAILKEKLVATDSVSDAIDRTELSLICVGTPSEGNGSLNLEYIESVSKQIGLAISRKDTPHYVVVRSTVLPGTTRDLVVPAIEKASGKVAGKDFFIAMNPEFLREGTAIKDFYAPPLTVIGEMHKEIGDKLSELYSSLPGELVRTDLEVAEMAKYVSNTWHAAKVCFGNEVGVLAKAFGVDGRDVMELVCKDSKLNISPTYLTPGFAFGGSCLPKDVKAITHRAKKEDVETPLLNSIMESNSRHINHGLKLITKFGKKRIGMLGLSFKADTDDLRESPLLELVERLVGKGYEVNIYDKNVFEAFNQRTGNHLADDLSHLKNIISNNLYSVIQESDVLVFGNNSSEFKDILTNRESNKHIVDLVGVAKKKPEFSYEGICW